MKYKLIMKLTENKKVIYYVQDENGRIVSPLYKRQSAAKDFLKKLNFI